MRAHGALRTERAIEYAVEVEDSYRLTLVIKGQHFASNLPVETPLVESGSIRVWATNLRSPASVSELRLASHPSLMNAREGCPR